MVESVGGGNGADEDEHDEAHALLAVVGAVGEADAGAGEDEQGANPEGRRRGAFGRFVEPGIVSDELEEEEEDGSQPKPTTGETRRALKTLVTWSQSTPAVPELPCMSWLAMPTPMMEPIRVWELEAGRPSHQVPRFQMMAAMSRAKTMAKPAPLPTWRMSSTGSSEMMVKATAPERVSTPMRFHDAGPDDGDVGLERVGVDDGGDGVGGVVEAVDELEAESDEQGDAEENVGEDGGGVDDGEIAGELADRCRRGRRGA